MCFIMFQNTIIKNRNIVHEKQLFGPEINTFRCFEEMHAGILAVVIGPRKSTIKSPYIQ